MKKKGRLHFYFETGTEGGFWAFEEDGEKGYDALHILNDGDSLVIYDRLNPKEIMWQGVIELEHYPSFEIPVGGFWVHDLQVGVTRELWGSWFFNEHLAILVTN